MPLKRLLRDHRVTTWRGVEFWMADEAGSLVFCRISHDALRDHAKRAHFEGTDDKVFDAYRELLEQLASDAFDAGKADEADCVLVIKEALNCAPAGSYLALLVGDFPILDGTQLPASTVLDRAQAREEARERQREKTEKAEAGKG